MMPYLIAGPVDGPGSLADTNIDMQPERLTGMGTDIDPARSIIWLCKRSSHHHRLLAEQRSLMWGVNESGILCTID